MTITAQTNQRYSNNVSNPEPRPAAAPTPTRRPPDAHPTAARRPPDGRPRLPRKWPAIRASRGENRAADRANHLQINSEL